MGRNSTTSNTFMKSIPLWLFCVVVILLFLVKLTPLSDFFYKVYQNRKKAERENYKDAVPKMNNLKEKQELFFKSLIKLKEGIDNNSITQKDIQEFTSKVDDLLGGLLFICDGVESGCLAKNTHLTNIINTLLKHKHDKKDNMIIDTHNFLKNAYNGIKIDFKQPARIDTYDILFRVYRSNFSCWTRFRGFFCNKVFDIN